MDQSLKDIVDMRSDIILESLRWGPAFVGALQAQRVLPDEVIDTIEERTESKSRRLQLFIKYLPQQSNRSFNRFLKVLQKLKCTELAIILQNDFDAIENQHVFDLKKGHSVTSVNGYLDFIDEHLLSKFEERSLTYDERKVLVKELRQYMEDIGRFFRMKIQRKEQLRRAVVRMVDPTFAVTPQWRAPTINLLDSEGLNQWDAHEGKVDKQLHGHIESYVDSLEVQVKQLQGELERLEGNVNKKGNRSSWKTDKQGNKVYVEDDHVKCEENFIHIAKEDAQQILRMLKPHRKVSLSAQKSDPGSPSNLYKAGESIKEEVKHLTDLIERLKDRLMQTSERITELEKEKGTVYEALKEDDLDRPLQDVVMERLKEVTEEKNYLETEVESLRKNIESLAAEHRNAMQMMYSEDGGAKPSPRAVSAVRKESTSSQRNRRISAPAMNAQKNGTASPVSSAKTTKRVSVTSAKPRRVSTVKLPLNI